MASGISLETFRDIVESSLDAVVVINSQGEIIYWNHSAERMFGYSQDEILGQYVHQVLPAESLKAKANTAFKRFRKTGESQLTGKDLYLKGQTKSGKEFDVQFSLNTIAVNGEKICYAFLRDVSGLVELQNRLEHLASVDELTNTFNRRAFICLFSKVFSFSKRHGTSYSVLMLDIDLFKAVNDKYGHQAGDIALNLFGTSIAKILRKEDVFGRIGGEEFCILLPNTSVISAKTIAEKIRKRVEALVIAFEQHSFSITVSIGVSNYKSSDKQYVESQQRADKALYRAKQNGRNRIEVDSD